jgi:CRISPR-associated protein Cmr1
MKQVTFTLRTLTPLFLTGADQTSAELRAPSFRGLMRYWYRALIGSVVGANKESLPLVMKAETAIFGATDTGSNISIRLSEASKDPQRFRKESHSRENTSGRDYLLWSMAASGKGDRYKPDRLLFPKDTIFRVTLSSKGDDDAKLQQAIAAFWLLTHLGGIGSRSRRCAGSVTVDNIDGDDNKTGLYFATPENIEDLQYQISEGIKITQKLARENLPPSILESVTQTTFDALSQKACNIWILHNDNWRTPDTVMRAIGSNLQTYRRGLPLQSRTIFGLPLMGVDNRSRHASPLLLRVVELQKGNYAGLAVLFKTGHNRDYTLIEKWANGFPGRTKVML